MSQDRSCRGPARSPAGRSTHTAPVWSENWILQRTNTRCDFCSTSYCLGNIVNWQCTGWILNPTLYESAVFST